MPEVTIDIAGKSYTVFCDDGQEAHLDHLAREVDARARNLARAAKTESQLLMLTTLMLADELEAAKTNAPSPAPDAITSPTLVAAIQHLNQRVQNLAESLEEV